MFSSIFNTSRGRNRRRRPDRSPFASTYAPSAAPPKGGRTYSRHAYHDESDDETAEDIEDEEEEDEQEEENDTDQETSPLLPIFDSTLLDTLPIYILTHTIRLLVVAKCETVLSWEQLRSPQVSQFLLKPIQQEIKTNHFSAATIYCLLANCLQFTKEAVLYPGNSGTSKTRAMICELLAIKLLREYTTRELIDVLSYDFDPLHGQVVAISAPGNDARASWQASRIGRPKSVRISCLEIAIRAQAKRFLAHPLVVQHLQAIWDGSIVIHSAADSMHRKVPTGFRQPNYGTTGNSGLQQEGKDATTLRNLPRRMVTLYDPQDASLFKLSRLRVPRYRSILSTMSFAVLLGLFIAVLVQRSLEITGLEIVFWFWAAGYMLDEIVGFNEQGFGLYIASFWNTFDLGILLLLFVHLCLRIYGILMVDVHKHTIANTAYDVLAADAILLFPRLFSVLDHYRYFSQLIIAFRMMAADLMAVFILIVISCSGFFVALSLSFGNDGRDDPSSVAYALLQMLMGFTPAVWDRWNDYTLLGRAILTLFLFICHFLVVTILITVLTNSFMAVVQNANEEHQFLFAVNTISNVKSDALFSYVAPLNVLQWLLTPLRYILPFRQYVKVNRTVIKATHFPILFSVYLYEKVVLQSVVVDRIDMIENRGHTKKAITQKLPKLRRELSIATFRQDQALEEVFKQPFDATLRTVLSGDRQKSTNVVSHWMNEMGADVASPPQEQDPQVVDKLERRKVARRNFSAFSRPRNVSRRAMSIASDPVDMTSHADYFFSPSGRISSAVSGTPTPLEIPSQQDGADGDDELLTNDNDDDDRMTLDVKDTETDIMRRFPANVSAYVKSKSKRPGPGRRKSSQIADRDGSENSSGPELTPRMPTQKQFHDHKRNVSSATMIYDPPLDIATDKPSSQSTRREDNARMSALASGVASPTSKHASSGAGRKTPKTKAPPQFRPLLPSKENAVFRSTPNLQAVLGFSGPSSPHRRPSLEMDLVSDIGDNKALGGGYVGALPASFAAQMAAATGLKQQRQQEQHEQQEILSRVMMARMNSLEEGFRGVIHEMRESIKSNTPSRRSRSTERAPRITPQTVGERRKGKEKMRSGGTSAEEGSYPLAAAAEARKPSTLSVTTNISAETAFKSVLEDMPKEIDEDTVRDIE